MATLDPSSLQEYVCVCVDKAPLQPSRHRSPAAQGLGAVVQMKHRHIS